MRPNSIMVVCMAPLGISATKTVESAATTLIPEHPRVPLHWALGGARVSEAAKGSLRFGLPCFRVPCRVPLKLASRVASKGSCKGSFKGFFKGSYQGCFEGSFQDSSKGLLHRVVFWIPTRNLFGFYKNFEVLNLGLVVSE